MLRRTFLSAGSAAGVSVALGTRATATVRPFELAELSISELADGLGSGRWTTRRLTKLYLERIRALDRQGPELRAVIELNPDAMADAERLDRERKAGGAKGRLHGIPILVKDNIEIAGRMSTSAGSLALEKWSPRQDAFIAARLRAAGALFLGKTNLSEWANFRSTRSVSGWSGRGGQTRNPYALDRNPSGSSSGSGAGVAANLCAAAIGSETDGSITSPSAINGIVGIKPTIGLLSRSGVVPISASQDTVGPMARNVRSVAILLGVMTGVDPEDAATAASAGRAVGDYTRFLNPAGLQGARLGIARKFFENNALVDRFFSTCVDTLKKAGAEVIDPADLPTHGQMDAPEGELLLYEFKDGLNRYLARLPAGSRVRSLRELIEFNERNRPREMPFFDQELLVQSEAKGPLTDAHYLKVRDDCQRLSRKEGIDAVVAKYRLDALVALTSGPAWYIDTINGDHDTGGCTTPAAVAGYPHITVPAGFYRGLPMGISFFGPAWSEGVLLKLAYGWEQATKARRAPLFRARAED
ncbi:MAG TPA: amidase [Bryobacteraceae bacterium]|jgi:amidase